MKKKVYVLDSSAIIGGFYSGSDMNCTTEDVLLEIKDFKSKILIESLIKEGLITISKPDEEDIVKIDEIIRVGGEVLRLSETDKKILALGLSLKKHKYYPIVVTDDYTMMNVLKHMKIPYESVLTDGITQVFKWAKICKGCKKRYDLNYRFEKCEICGTRILIKRIN
jgi:endoribonuclease Nob1